MGEQPPLSHNEHANNEGSSKDGINTIDDDYQTTNLINYKTV